MVLVSPQTNTPARRPSLSSNNNRCLWASVVYIVESKLSRATRRWYKISSLERFVDAAR